MNKVQWFYPENIKEIPDILKSGAIPHGGGTSILRSRKKNLTGLIDFSNIHELHEYSIKNDSAVFGAAMTFSETAKNSEKIYPDHILFKALSRSAAAPLRNRITLGGSISAFPLWSDLMGPLLALNAEVDLTGSKQGLYPVSEYINNKDLHKGTIIKSVKVKTDKWISYYHREVRTSFDYPACTLTILAKISANIIEEIRIILIGTKKRYKKLYDIENSLKGMQINKCNSIELQFSSFDFSNKISFSAEYLQNSAQIYIKRGLDFLAGADQ